LPPCGGGEPQDEDTVAAEEGQAWLITLAKRTERYAALVAPRAPGASALLAGIEPPLQGTGLVYNLTPRLLVRFIAQYLGVRRNPALDVDR